MNVEFSWRNTIAARSLILGLVQAGVRHFTFSPGFRSAPLTLALQTCAEELGLSTHAAIDERGAAFLALGCGKALGFPAVAICTSGTAAGNFVPAAMEARHGATPLILITADRPLELLHSGANQTTDQRKFFSGFSLFDGEFAVGGRLGGQNPFEEECGELYSLGKRLVAESLASGGGPVHLNLRLSEPLLPALEQEAELLAFLQKTLPSLLPHANSLRPGLIWPAEQDRKLLESSLAGAHRPLVLVGPEGGGLTSELLNWFRERNIPILAEPASGLSGSGIYPPEIVLDEMAKGAVAVPDLVLRLGGPLTGRAMERAKRNKLFGPPSGALYLVLDGPGQFRNPEGIGALALQADRACWTHLMAGLRVGPKDSGFSLSIDGFFTKREKALTAHLENEIGLSEWHFHRWLSEAIPELHNVFLGNSMPIRDWNSVAAPRGGGWSTFANRGLSGIDGILATAAGVALATKRPTHLLVGDLSFLHDLPSLLFRNQLSGAPLVVWLLNNNGGEIFRLVGTGSAPGEAQWYSTPQEFDASALAKAFGWSFLRVQSQKDLESLDPSSILQPSIIEVVVSGEANKKARSFRG